MEGENQQEQISIQNPNPPPKSFLKSHRFSWGVIGFLLGLPIGYGLSIAWALIVNSSQPNLELGVILLIFPMFFIILLTPLLTFYFGYLLGKEKDFPEEKEVLRAQSKKKFIKFSIIYSILLFLLIFLWPFMVIPILKIQDIFFSPKPLPEYTLPTPTLNQPSPTPTPDPTAISDSIGVNWKTYTNNKYGYSLDYPGSWVTEGDDDLINFYPFNFSEEEWIKMTKGSSLSPPNISVSIIPIPFSQSPGKIGKIFITQPTQILVGGKQGYFYEPLCAPMCGKTVDIPYKDDKTLRITLMYLVKENLANINKTFKIENIDEKIFNQILQTFKFTE